MADEFTYYCNESADKLNLSIADGSNGPLVVVNARRVYLNVQQVEELRSDIYDLMKKCLAETSEQS